MSSGGTANMSPNSTWIFQKGCPWHLLEFAATENQGHWETNLQVVGISCVQAWRGTGGTSTTRERAVASGWVLPVPCISNTVTFPRLAVSALWEGNPSSRQHKFLKFGSCKLLTIYFDWLNMRCFAWSSTVGLTFLSRLSKITFALFQTWVWSTFVL